LLPAGFATALAAEAFGWLALLRLAPALSVGLLALEALLLLTELLLAALADFAFALSPCVISILKRKS
jgi:hypothetical protein